MRPSAPRLAIAVQDLAENLLVLAMVGGYTLTENAGLPIAPLIADFSVFMKLAISMLWINRVGRRGSAAVAGMKR